jgi:molecular chaperone HtpG
MTTESLNFGADVSRLLEIVTHALYSNREVFLRELISNGADACDRLRYDGITQPDLLKGHPGFYLRLTPDREERTLTVLDTGVGMNKDELAENLGTIAKSGTRALLDQMKQSGTAGPSLIGQFGVGFYSSFMVANHVDVISRRAGSSETWVWGSDGQQGYTLREATPEEAAKIPGPSGTRIVLAVKDESADFLIEEKLEQVVLTYSNHVGLPIYIGQDSTKAANAASALWMRPKSEIAEEQYNEFFNAVSGAMGIDQPLLTSHWKAEGKIEYTSLLFVPSLRPWDLYDPTRKHAVRLYVRRVFITDDCEGLIYPWLRFLRGVIDSEDLQLNISREMLQHSPVIGKIRSSVAKHILSDLDKLAKNDPVAFETFWLQFGAVVKEGLYDAAEHRHDIFKIARFASTNHEKDQTSLDGYLSRMKDGQEGIFYISGENLDSLRRSPQLEGFKKRGIEVLLLKDTIDEFWIQATQDYLGKKFTSVTKGMIDLTKFPVTDSTESTATPETAKNSESRTSLTSYLKDRLKEYVSDVRTSSRLTDSPVCLVASDQDVDLHMGRVLKIHQHYETKVKPVLEINPDHPLIAQLDALAASGTESSRLADAADLLLDQARIIQGEPVADPAGFARRMADFMRHGLAA